MKSYWWEDKHTQIGEVRPNTQDMFASDKYVYVHSREVGSQWEYALVIRTGNVPFFAFILKDGKISGKEHHLHPDIS